MHKTITKRVYDLVRVGGKSDALRIVPKIKIWLYYQMVYAQARIHVVEWNIKLIRILRYKRIT